MWIIIFSNMKEKVRFLIESGEECIIVSYG